MLALTTGLKTKYFVNLKIFWLTAVGGTAKRIWEQAW